MDNLIPVNYETDQPCVSARDLYEQLNIKTAFKDWFPRMCEYGFEEGKDFCSKMSESTGGRPSKDADISIDMAKQICMIQRSPEGNRTIDKLKTEKAALIEDNERMKPKEIFADAVTASKDSILIGDLAKILKQKGIDIGQNRLFQKLRNNGYLIQRRGPSWNMPTQKSMEMRLFEVEERTITNPDGTTKIRKTTKVTGKGQQYFINKLLAVM